MNIDNVDIIIRMYPKRLVIILRSFYAFRLIQFSIHSKHHADHSCMRYNIIIYKLHWFTSEDHKKGEAKYNKCKKRKHKYKKKHANVGINSQEEQTLFRSGK